MCSSQSVVTFQKPLQHCGLDDWHARINKLRSSADTYRNDSFDLRNCARSLRNETNVQTEWDTYQNNARLSDRSNRNSTPLTEMTEMLYGQSLTNAITHWSFVRISLGIIEVLINCMTTSIAELDRWRITMEHCMARIDKEIDSLTNEKNLTEQDMESMVMPLTVVSECLTTRDSRVGPELTYDDVDIELQKELSVVENNQKMLREQCHIAWEKLNRLAEAKFKVGLEITNKTDAEELDVKQLGLNKFCSNISYKPDPMRVCKNSSTYGGWLDHSQNIKQIADNELEDAYAMRESLFVCREKARNVLRAQQDRTEHTIRKRIFETQRARNELEWQQLKMKEEMEKCLNEIQQLEDAYRAKADILKLAETRLENRAQRSGMELCNDEPHHGLCDEVRKLRETRRILNDQLNSAKTTYITLEGHSNRIETDLNNKNHTLMTDIRGLDLRMRLKDGKSSSFNTQTDRNIQLTKMEEQIPKN